MSILFTAIFSGIEIIWDKQFGFLKETLVAPVSRLKIMIGRTLGGTTVSVLQGVIVLLISLLIGFKIHNFIALPLALIFMFLIGWIIYQNTIYYNKINSGHVAETYVSFDIAVILMEHLQTYNHQ